MNLRLITDETFEADYAVIRQWWDGHKWPEVPAVCLRGNMGLIVEHEGAPLLAGWVITASACPIGWLEWIVSNPTNTPFLSAKALSALLGFAAEECKRRGYGALLTTCRQKSLGRFYQKSGYAKSDEGVDHFIKILQET